jgi:hypothetical protein
MICWSSTWSPEPKNSPDRSATAPAPTSWTSYASRPYAAPRLNDRASNVLPACCVTSTRPRCTCAGGASCSTTCSSVASSPSVMVVRTFEPPNAVARSDPGLDDRRRTARADVDHHAGARRVLRRVLLVRRGSRRRRCGSGRRASRRRRHRRRAVGAVRDVERDEGVGDVGVGQLEVRCDVVGTSAIASASVDRRSPSGPAMSDIDRVDDAVDHDDARAVEGRDPVVEVGRAPRAPVGGGPKDSSPSMRCGAYRHASSRLVG